MNFGQLDNHIKEKIDNISLDNINETFDFLYDNTIIKSLICNGELFTIVEDCGDYYIIGIDKVFSSIIKAENYLSYDNEFLCEDLALAKFRYSNYKHDPFPHALILDNDYIYDGKGKIVPGQHDVLAFNIDYADNKKLSEKSINEISTFAHMLKKNKKDVYKRIKDFYPDSLKFIRRYKPNYMNKIKMMKGNRWVQASVADLTNDEENEYK